MSQTGTFAPCQKAVDAAISSLTQTLPDHAPLCVGFSGGGDSLYLLLRLRSLYPERACHALIVDHAIRTGSGQDAKRAAQIADEAGAVAHILHWDGARLHGHAAARNARYKLLAACMQKLGADQLFLAHTQDDQLETFFLRAQSGSGWRGLAGMTMRAAFPLWPEGHGLEVWRPVLGLSRADIRVDLAQAGAEWIDDPANMDHRYARVRVRSALQEMEAAGWQRGGVLSTMTRLQDLRWARDRVLSRMRARWCVMDELGFARIDPHLLKLPPQWSGPVLAQIAMIVAGLPRLPDGAALMDAANSAMAGHRRTKSQCLFLRRDNALWVVRDPGGVCGRSGVPAARLFFTQAGQVGWFDNRWHIYAPGPGCVFALCDRQSALSQEDQNAIQSLPHMVKKTLPVWDNGTEIRILPLAHRDQCAFSGPNPGLETGTGFA